MSEAAPARAAARTLRVRWWIYACMFGFAAVAYLQRTTISVSAPALAESLDLGKPQLGALFLAFTMAYALGRLPGGALGQRLGPRRALAGVGLLYILATLAAGLAPDLRAASSSRPSSRRGAPAPPPAPRSLSG